LREQITLTKIDTIDDIFTRFLNNIHIFVDREVLRHDYIPNKLPHRDKQINCLGGIVAPVLRGSPCSNAFIYGKTGTGKTAVTKYVLNKLSNKAHELGASIEVCYVNCRLVGTEYRVLSSLCNALGIKVPFTGLALGEVFDRFKKGFDKHKKIFIVVLDEIDALIKNRGDTLLYELTRINQTLKYGRISIIGISNDLRFKEFLDPRVLSSLSEEEIVFRPYDATELQDILWKRAQLAFSKEAISDSAVALCAAFAAAEHGDARRALDLLRVAGELAERQGEDCVTEDNVRQAEKRVEHDRIIEVLENLPVHSKLVLCSVYLLGQTKMNYTITGDIYGIYCELCDQSGINPLTQRRVSGLISELDMIGVLNARVVSMGRHGRTKKIRLGIGRIPIKKVFSDNTRFQELLSYTPNCFSDLNK
jgi:cell division control protein 6